MGRIRSKLSYANVMSTLAVFLALAGGVAWALERNSVHSAHIVNGDVQRVDLAGGSKTGAVTGEKVRRESLTGKDFDERACPRKTRFYGGSCIEVAARPPTTSTSTPGSGGLTRATTLCAADGRRLPTFSELTGFRSKPGITLADSEITSDMHDDADVGIAPKYMAIDDDGARSNYSQSTNNAFRCVATPLAP